MLSLVLWCIAALLNGVMDSLEEGHFHRSIFRNLNPKFWYKYESWKHAKMIFGYRLDAWHICKSLMIICLAAAVAPSVIIFPNYWLNLASLGVIWNLIFNAFYNHILKKP
jgi:hypothetical protein